MYIFVRFQGFLTMLAGFVVMLLSIAAGVIGWMQNAFLVDWINRNFLYASYYRLIDARFYVVAASLIVFLVGWAITANGQLLLAFANIASNTRETNKLLRNMAQAQAPLRGPNLPAEPSSEEPVTNLPSSSWKALEPTSPVQPPVAQPPAPGLLASAAAAVIAENATLPSGLQAPKTDPQSASWLPVEPPDPAQPSEPSLF